MYIIPFLLVVASSLALWGVLALLILVPVAVKFVMFATFIGSLAMFFRTTAPAWAWAAIVAGCAAMLAI